MNYEVTVLEYGKYIRAIEWLDANVNDNDWWQDNGMTQISSWQISTWLKDLDLTKLSLNERRNKTEPINEIFIFKNANDALLFKLKWG